VDGKWVEAKSGKRFDIVGMDMLAMSSVWSIMRIDLV
jgi:hypothetical protein